MVIEPFDAGWALSGDPLLLEVSLQDEYGNPANPQPPSLTVDLASDSATGKFYDEYGERISQVTFTENWWRYDQTKFVFYLDETPGTYELSGTTSYLDRATAQVTILPLPAGISLTAPSSAVIYERVKVTVTLMAGNNTEYAVPGQLEGGLQLDLATDAPGEFFDAQVGGQQIWNNVVSIPPGKSSVDVYYRPMSADQHNLTVSVSGHPQVPSGQVSLNVTEAGAVRVTFDSLPDFTAGKAAPVTVTVRDQYGNPVKQAADLQVQLSTNVKERHDGQWVDKGPSPTGGFYSGVDANGQPVGEPITSVTIPQGSVSATVYYYDTTAETVKPGEYKLYLQVASPAVDGESRLAHVQPAPASKLGLKLGDYKYWYLKTANGDIGIGDTDLVLTEPDTDRILRNVPFPLDVTILDQYNNPVPLSTPVTVNLSASEAVYGKFYLNLQNPITQLILGEGSPKKTIYFVAGATGTATITASAAGLAIASLDGVQVLAPDRLAIHFPLVKKWENGEWVKVEDDRVGPEGRKAVGIVYTDAVGHPATAEADIQVSLAVDGGGAFYKDPGSGNAITTVTIPKGYHGAVVYYEAPNVETTVTLKATADGLGAWTRNLTVSVKPYWVTSAAWGWNIISTPVALERNKLSDVVVDADKYLQIAYAYDEVNKKWLQIVKDTNGKWVVGGAEFQFEPLDAIYVKLSGYTKLEYYPLRSVSSVPTRDLVPGWNLISPALDLSAYEFMKPAEVLASVRGKYSQVVSPGLGFQQPWAYVPLAADDPGQDMEMEAGRGYWVYMKEAGTLAGFSYTPVRHGPSSYSPSGGVY